MRIVVSDYETLFDRRDYTVSKMSTEAYIRDPRFEIHGIAVKWGPDHAAQWYDRRYWQQIASTEDWSDTLLISHHRNFDGLIDSHHYNVHPKMNGCTLSMARLMLGNHLSVSLDAVRKHYGIPLKHTPYDRMDGKHWHEMDPATQRLVADGACDEVESIWRIFGLLLRDGFPKEELEVVDSTIKMFTEPVLRADIPMLREIWKGEAERRARMLEDLSKWHQDEKGVGVTAADFQSVDKFAALLRLAGVDPETKNSPSDPDKQIWAFAKSDQFMRDLLEDPDDLVRSLAEARVSTKSNLMQTRSATIGQMARRGPLCVYLNYAGAHTTRDSGGDGSNFTNLKRADPDNPKQASPLRRAIMAPEDCVLAIVDESQIECRLLNTLAGQEDVLDNFRSGRDPYTGIASQFYGRAITKEDKEERGTGKQAELSCGFGCGPPKFKRTAALGIYGPPVHLAIEEAERMVKLYRDTHDAVCGQGGYWSQAGRMIARIAGGDPYQWGPMVIRDGKIFGPGGTMLHYETLEHHLPTEEEKEKLAPFKWKGFWRYRTRNGWAELYHTKLVENVVQWLARVIFMQAAMRVRRMGYHIATRTYDEIVVVLRKDGSEEKHLQMLIDEMRRTPDWLPGIPLDAEGHLSERYEK